MTPSEVRPPVVMVLPVIDVCEIVRHIRLAHHPLRLGAVEADALTIWRAHAGMQHDEGEGEEERERE